MENETTSAQSGAPTDGELLSELLDYLGTFSGTLDLLVEHLRDGAKTVTMDDGEQTDVAPVDALDNATNALVAKCMEVGSKRILRDQSPEGDAS